MKNPLVSVIVLNWNNSEDLEICLTALKKQTYKRVCNSAPNRKSSIEVIIVNAKNIRSIFLSASFYS